MELKLQPTWVTVGRNFTVECRVPAVSPLEKLTLTLLRGKEPLHVQTFGKATAVPQEAVATHNITAHREDGHHNFSCQAELDLRDLGGSVLRKVSEPQGLEIHGEGEPPGQREGGGWHSLWTVAHSLAAQGLGTQGPALNPQGSFCCSLYPEASPSPQLGPAELLVIGELCDLDHVSLLSLWPWLLSTMRSGT